MITGTRPTGSLGNAIISARCFEPFDVKTRDGKPARLAIIDEQGNIVADGPEVAKEAWNLMINVYRNYLIGKGHIRVFSGDQENAVPNAGSNGPSGVAAKVRVD